VGLRGDILGGTGKQSQQSKDRIDQGISEGDTISESSRLCALVSPSVQGASRDVGRRRLASADRHGHLLRQSATRSGRVLDPRSIRESSLQERQKRQSEDDPLASRQGEPEVYREDLEASRRLWIAVLTQAFRDFCASEREVTGVLKWIKTPSFSIACAASDVDQDMAMDAFRNLARFDPPMRAKLMRGTIATTMGGQKRKTERD